MKYMSRSAITVYGTMEFLAWVKRQRPELHRWTLNELNYHPSIYLVDPEDQNCWGECFETHYKAIFDRELAAFQCGPLDVPEASPQLLSRWFRFEYHEDVCDLGTDPVEWWTSS